MTDYRFSEKFRELERSIQIEVKKFNDISDAFPNAEIIRSSGLNLVKSYESILKLADNEIDDKDYRIEDLGKECRDLGSDIFDLNDKILFKIDTLEDEMKVELFQAAYKKFTLVQLEEKLGNRFQLM